ncbi:MBL fold metallo-hydrolase [Elusimicrobiota bacterium]
MKIKTVVVGPIETNCHILCGTSTSIVIDPGAELSKIMRDTDGIALPITHIIYTHGHWDHTGVGRELKKATGAKLLMCKDDLNMLNMAATPTGLMFGAVGDPGVPDTFVCDGDKIRSGDMELVVLQTPGHSPGSISLLTEKILFSGDTLFKDSVGRTDLPGGDQHIIISSIRKKLFVLPDDVTVFPGHGGITNIKYEKKFNPYVSML